MNFINRIECEDMQVELKYCERCGGLFLRAGGATLAYCGPCLAHWVRLLSATPGDARRSGTRKANKPKLDANRTPNQIDSLHAIAIAEVRPC
jgi:hypothetical protein